MTSTKGWAGLAHRKSQASWIQVGSRIPRFAGSDIPILALKGTAPSTVTRVKSPRRPPTWIPPKGFLRNVVFQHSPWQVPLCKIRTRKQTSAYGKLSDPGGGRFWDFRICRYNPKSEVISQQIRCWILTNSNRFCYDLKSDSSGQKKKNVSLCRNLRLYSPSYIGDRPHGASKYNKQAPL